MSWKKSFGGMGKIVNHIYNWYEQEVQPVGHDWSYQNFDIYQRRIKLNISYQYDMIFRWNAKLITFIISIVISSHHTCWIFEVWITTEWMLHWLAQYITTWYDHNQRYDHWYDDIIDMMRSLICWDHWYDLIIDMFILIW